MELWAPHLQTGDGGHDLGSTKFSCLFPRHVFVKGTFFEAKTPKKWPEKKFSVVGGMLYDYRIILFGSTIFWQAIFTTSNNLHWFGE